MMKMKKLTILIPALLAFALFTGCQKDDSHPTSTLVISLTDAPASYTEVNVEVVDIEINCEGNGWIHVPVTDSIYNLLALGNHPAFLANAVLPSGTISQVRLILGTHNTVVVGADTFPLLLSSEDETGLKLNIHKNIVGGAAYDLLIDFDAEQSVVEEGNGSYRLKPVLTAELN
jgi:hypothetical protein